MDRRAGVDGMSKRIFSAPGGYRTPIVLLLSGHFTDVSQFSIGLYELIDE